MEIRHFNKLPDYVFDRSYDEYLFIWADNFYIPNECKKIIGVYDSVLLDCNEDSFSVYEVSDDNTHLVLLQSFHVTDNTPDDVVKNLLHGSFYDIEEYFTSVCMQAYLISNKTNMCIYWERSLEGMVIGCTKEIS